MGSAISVTSRKVEKCLFERIWKKTNVRRSDSNRGPLAPKSDVLTTWPREIDEKQNLKFVMSLSLGGLMTSPPPCGLSWNLGHVD